MSEQRPLRQISTEDQARRDERLGRVTAYAMEIIPPEQCVPIGHFRVGSTALMVRNPQDRGVLHIVTAMYDPGPTLRYLDHTMYADGMYDTQVARGQEWIERMRYDERGQISRHTNGDLAPESGPFSPSMPEYDEALFDLGYRMRTAVTGDPLA